MKNAEFFAAINDLCKERGLEKEKVLAAIERGVINAYKKEVGISNIRLDFNEEENEYNFFEYYNVVSDDELDDQDPSKVTLKEAKKHKKTAKIGDYFEIKRNVNLKEFGRLSINSTKQMLNQSIKQLEREKSYEFFSQHQDEVVDGVIVSINEKFVKVDLGMDTIVNLPIAEVGKSECVIGSRIKLYLSKVENTGKGPKLIASRSDKNLIKRLLEQYIPEVKDGIVDIKGIAREVGDRTKICVVSNDPNVDPLGACLGPKGSRIQEVIDRLDGEKIDLYEFSDDPVELVKNALKPAEVIGVTVLSNTDDEKKARVVVPDDQFSLAIGKKGLNVKLAVLSSGWKIDIKSVSQALEEGIDF